MRPERTRARTLLVVAALLLGLALVAWAARDTAPLVTLTEPMASAAPDLPVLPLPTTSPSPVASDALSGPVGPLRLGPAWLWRILVLAVLAPFAFLLARALVRALRRLMRDWQSVPGAQAPNARAIDLTLSEADRVRQVSALREGSPRNAIVATWVELEGLVEGAGIPRRRSETSSELVVRVLSDRDVPEEALTDLAALFREARFSTHELSEAHRGRAAGDLERIHASFTGPGGRAVVPAAAGTEAGPPAVVPAAGPAAGPVEP